MQHDIGASTSRTQTPTLPEHAVVGIRPLQHQYSTIHTTTALQPSCVLQATYRGELGAGDTRYPLTPFPSVHPPVQADRKSDRKSKERIKGKEEQAEKEEKDTSVSS
ncbi:hypothetical protein GBF38_018370 [Nibea albiflora]|uniref:Uncharacterized protein n=1 Tax=Nibea albiflora TaxID=240163 RepID=A0ACB7EFI3_NIBAL|nr:hypothetical protein GBF38_018370 [Nibea albiflora]